MLRIAEEYTKTIKTHPEEKYFFILEKIVFQKKNVRKNLKIEIWEIEENKRGKIRNCPDDNPHNLY